jgi:hypothetical protein
MRDTSNDTVEGHHREIERVRAYVRERAETTSIRIVAGYIGLGHSTVHNFLSGATPHPRVRRTLVEWYRTQISGDGLLEAVEAALAELCSRVPADFTLRTRGEILSAMETAYSDAGLNPPSWLTSAKKDA